MKTQGYPRNEKLKQKKETTLLFEKGKWKSSGRLRLIITKQEGTDSENTDIPGTVNGKIGVSVSKRYFKKAVDRNRIKRLLREAYRLNKEVFREKFGNDFLAMVFWNSAEKPHHYLDVKQEFLRLCQNKK